MGHVIIEKSNEYRYDQGKGYSTTKNVVYDFYRNKELKKIYAHKRNPISSRCFKFGTKFIYRDFKINFQMVYILKASYTS